MKKSELTRKQFLNLGLGLVGSTLIAESCAPMGDAPSDASIATGGTGAGTGGASTGGAGTGGAGTGGAGTGGAATGGRGTGGAGTGGSGTGGAATGGRGTGGAASGGSGAGGRGTGGRGTGGSGAGGRGTGGAGGTGTAGCTGAIMAAISGNHDSPHVLMIPLADIMAGAQKCYDAAGTAGHSHYVTLTAADFTTLKGGGVVRLFSCNGGDHQYVLSCGTPPAAAAPTCPNETPGSVACT